MAKRLLLLHIGPDAVDVAAMTEALALGAVVVPAARPDAFAHAQVEILRTHKAHGLRRKEVEGAWAAVCRRARKARSHCFLSVPGFFGATPEQAALALDGLAGFRVVLVATSGFTSAPPAAWAGLVKGERTHLLPSNLTAEQLGAQVARIALMEEEARLDKRITRLARRRRQVDRRLAA